MRVNTFIRVVASASLLFVGFTEADEIQIGRYIAKDNIPTQAQQYPLKAVTALSFPMEIETVGDAIEMTLQPSGYAVDFEANPETYLLFSLPLPQIHRNLGALTLDQILRTLAGSAFTLEINDLYRTVSFNAKEEVSQSILEQAQGVWLSGARQPSSLSAQLYLVTEGESLSGIARDLGVISSDWPAFVDTVFTANPHAFIDHDINKLRAGVELELPL